MTRPGWHDDALCAQVGDHDLWFPEKGGSTKAAVDVCARCPVQAECLDDALAHGDSHGIWGGTSERQRRELRHLLGMPDVPTPRLPDDDLHHSVDEQESA